MSGKTGSEVEDFKYGIFLYTAYEERDLNAVVISEAVAKTMCDELNIGLRRDGLDDMEFRVEPIPEGKCGVCGRGA